jgi:hypothetical protein
LNALLATKQVEQSSAQMNESQRKNPRRLFRAAEVHLKGFDEPDLIVIGNASFLTGADNCWYWVVRSALKNPRVVLFASGTSLELTESTTNGYKDIRSVWASPTEQRTIIYHFEGSQYELWSKLDQRTDIK